MSKQFTIKILSFHRRKTNASGRYRLDFVSQRGKEILHYTLSTQDYEYAKYFCSPSHMEHADTIIFMAELLLEIHKMKRSCLERIPSQAYVTPKYISRINQMCKKNHYHKTPVITDGLQYFDLS